MQAYTSEPTPEVINSEAIKALAEKYGVSVRLRKCQGWVVTQCEFCDHELALGRTKRDAWYGLIDLLKYWTEKIILPNQETDARIAVEKALEGAILAEMGNSWVEASAINAFDAKLSVDLREDFLYEMEKAGLLEVFESKGNTFRGWRLKGAETDLEADILNQLAEMHANGISKVQKDDIPVLRQFTELERLSHMEHLQKRGLVDRIIIGGVNAWFIAKKSKRAAVLAELQNHNGWATADEVKALEGMNPDHKVPFLREMVMDGLLVMTRYGANQTLCFGHGITF